MASKVPWTKVNAEKPVLIQGIPMILKLPQLEKERLGWFGFLTAQVNGVCDGIGNREVGL